MSNNIALFLIVLILFLMLISMSKIQESLNDIIKKKHNNIVLISIFLLGVCAVIFAIFAPSFLGDLKIAKSKDNIMSPNEIGDMFGGTMAPFIGIGGVIFTFLAFYMQKTANDDIKKQFQSQQFESQFYEMLRLHKENVNEIRVIAKDINISIKEEKIHVKGNLSFLSHNFQVIKPHDLHNLRTYHGREAFRIMKNEFEIYYSEAKTIKLNDINEDDFHAAYELFFWGVKGYSRQDKRNLWQRLEPEDFIDKLQQKILGLINVGDTSDPLNLDFNHETLNEVVLGNGYSAHLGHYYRHLYHTVKFVADEKNINYEQKRNYLKILRGQLSNYEQIMLFYNWMSSYGSSWENKDNKYFTKYKIIHNLWYNELILDDYLKQKLFCLVKTYEELKLTDDEVKIMEKGKSLFESEDNIILDFNINKSICS